MKDKIKNVLMPNQFMLDNYFIPTINWICKHERFVGMLTVAFAPLVILYAIWYIISLIDDLGDFIWFKFLDLHISLLKFAEPVVDYKNLYKKDVV